MEATTEKRVEGATTEHPCSSFAKSLFLGEIHEELVFPWPQPDPDEQDKVRALIAAAHELGSRLDPR
jgi:acyl-CoA dehydrogenase family protein 9